MESKTKPGQWHLGQPRRPWKTAGLRKNHRLKPTGWGSLEDLLRIPFNLHVSSNDLGSALGHDFFDVFMIFPFLCSILLCARLSPYQPCGPWEVLLQRGHCGEHRDPAPLRRARRPLRGPAGAGRAGDQCPTGVPSEGGAEASRGARRQTLGWEGEKVKVGKHMQILTHSFRGFAFRKAFFFLGDRLCKSAFFVRGMFWSWLTAVRQWR